MRARLGNDVYRGDVLALIVDPTSTGGEPVAVRVPRNGVLTARHHRGLISAGDCLALIADEVQR
jgi:N-alpha-acetyl-L-2,4-diaminobutyrate deacetylase